MGRARRSFPTTIRKLSRSLPGSVQRRATSWTWRGLGRWLGPGSGEIRVFAREKGTENLGAEIGLRRVLIWPNRHRHGEVGVVQLRFDDLNFVLLHQQERGIQL